MSKVLSNCLLFAALVFSNAHAPTFQIWKDLPAAATHADDVDTAGDAYLPLLAYAHFALGRELSEGDELTRFQLDEFYLPTLDVELPSLFGWNDGEYLADSAPPMEFDAGLGAMTHEIAGLVRAGSRGISARSARGASIAAGAGAMGSVGQVGQVGQVGKSAAGADSADPSTAPSASTPTSDPNSSTSDSSSPQIEDDRHFDGDPADDLPIDWLLPPIDGSPQHPPAIDDRTPVQVPAPAPFGLFVLGLAALHLAGRKKNGSG